MGILNPTYDAFNLDNNYGPQANNRKHIFNAAYSYDFGRLVRHRFAGAVMNGWQISGITQIQSGVNLTGHRGQNFAMNLNAFKIPGTTHNVSSASLFGTPNILLTPILTCDPTENLAPQQFINASCFSFPRNPGERGATILPAIYGPAFFNSDLGLFKTFSISEGKRLQFRANAYNFLNHPLWSFPANQNLTLGFNGTTGQLNTPLFGTTTTKQGRRIIQFAATFSF
jgi:hypothetical protein